MPPSVARSYRRSRRRIGYALMAALWRDVSEGVRPFLWWRPPNFPRLYAKAVASGVEFSAPLILFNGDHRFLVREEAEQAGIAPCAILIEPSPRNTAMAVAAIFLEQHEPGAIPAVIPSDHAVKDEARFRSSQARRGHGRASNLVLLVWRGLQFERIPSLGLPCRPGRKGY